MHQSTKLFVCASCGQFCNLHIGLASLKKRRKDSRLILLYKGLKGKARIPMDDLIHKTRRCRNQCHFRYPQLVKMPTNIVSFPRLSGTGITSLNHCFPLLKCQMIVCPNSRISCESLGLIFPQAHPLVRYCHFGVSPVNYSDSDQLSITTFNVYCYFTKRKSIIQRLLHYENAPIITTSIQ